MKRSNLFMVSVAAVLALGLANAAGDYVDTPIVLQPTQSSVEVKSGATTYVQMTQDPAAWGINPIATNFKVFVDKTGYAPQPTKALNDWFWVLPDGTPDNWAVYIPRSVSTMKGNVQMTYGFRIPASAPAGTYNLMLKVRDQKNGNINIVPISVVIPTSYH